MLQEKKLSWIIFLHISLGHHITHLLSMTQKIFKKGYEYHEKLKYHDLGGMTLITMIIMIMITPESYFF